VTAPGQAVAWDVAVAGRPQGAARAALAVACALAVVGPALVGYEDYLLFNASVAMVYLLLATGYNVLLGMCGQLAMSHVAFFGIGAYASALATRDAGCRTRSPSGWRSSCRRPAPGHGARGGPFVGPYLAMITFAFHSMALTIFINWTDVTNGWAGCPGSRRSVSAMSS
jgi:branched-chain amino acid transport system permease protein